MPSRRSGGATRVVTLRKAVIGLSKGKGAPEVAGLRGGLTGVSAITSGTVSTTESASSTHWERPWTDQHGLARVLAHRLLWDRDLPRKETWTLRRPPSDLKG